MVSKLLEKAVVGIMCFFLFFFVAGMIAYSILVNGRMNQPKR